MGAVINSFVGVDVSQLTLDYCLERNGKVYTSVLRNEAQAIRAWVADLPKACQVVFEPTGTYSDRLQRILEQNQIDYSLVPCYQSKMFAAALGKENKTDKEDAQTLMLMGKSLNLAVTKAPSKKMQQRKQLFSALNALDKQARQLSNQLHALEQYLEVVPLATQALEASLAVVEAQSKKIEAELRTYTDEEEALTMNLMMSVPGIGPKTSQLLVQLTNCFKDFETDKQLVSFVGTAPRVRQSGTSVRQRGSVSKRGNSKLRSSLYMAARSARRYNPSCEALYNRLREKGKPHKVAMIAVINKMLRQAFTIVKTGVPYDKDYDANKK